jgi:ADP-heptose:LPS heptosyltransferase
LNILRELVGDDVYSLHVQLDDVFDPLPNDGWKQNFYKTACHMKAMKAVVAPDTATAHLAGALGVKCFLMLPDDNFICWRWKNATWYDSVIPLKKSDWHKLPSLLEEL